MRNDSAYCINREGPLPEHVPVLLICPSFPSKHSANLYWYKKTLAQSLYMKRTFYYANSKAPFLWLSFHSTKTCSILGYNEQKLMNYWISVRLLSLRLRVQTSIAEFKAGSAGVCMTWEWHSAARMQEALHLLTSDLFKCTSTWLNGTFSRIIKVQNALVWAWECISHKWVREPSFC